MLETVKKAFNKLGLLLFFYLALTTVTGSFLECSLRRPYRQKGQFSMLQQSLKSKSLYSAYPLWWICGALLTAPLSEHARDSERSEKRPVD